MKHPAWRIRAALQHLIFVFVFVIISLTASYSYLLFHSLVEMLSIITAFCIFILAWYSRKYSDNPYLIFTGVAFLFIGIIDTLHTFSYNGSGIFPGYDANLPTQLWIAARYLQAISFVIAPLFMRNIPTMSRTVWMKAAFVVYAIVTTIVLISIFKGVFPGSYIEGAGITQFKKVSEYIISFLLGLAMYLLYMERDNFDRSTYGNMIISLVLAIASEICFTFYFSVYDVANMIGHYFKIGSFYFLFLALVKSSLEEPFKLIFKNLEENRRKVLELNKAFQMMNVILRHDISNNLTVMGLNLDVFGKRSPKKQELENIKTAIVKSQNLIEKMKQLESAMKSGGKLIRFNVADVIRKIAENHPEVTIRLEGSAHIYADDAIHSVFENLIRNALVHGYASRITVSIRSMNYGIRIRVADNGRGIPRVIYRKLFKEGASYGKTGNTGLGLYIVKTTIERYGGTIRLGDAKPRGTVFTIDLPRKRS